LVVNNQTDAIWDIAYYGLGDTQPVAQCGYVSIKQSANYSLYRTIAAKYQASRNARYPAAKPCKFQQNAFVVSQGLNAAPDYTTI